jgi:Ribonuclease G/E
VSERAFFLDEGIGESRAVVTLRGRPERLMILREGDAAAQRLGARLAARVKSVERAAGLAFLDLGEGPDAILNLNPEQGPVREGAWLEVEIRAEARRGKGAQARWLGEAEGPARLIAPGPDLQERLTALAKTSPIRTGAAARQAADLAADEALETVFPLPDGGTIAVEPTRALTAVDVDLGARGGEGAKRAARAANLAAVAEAARILRLKGLGGLVVIDLAGRGADGVALAAAARSAFAPDNPGVAIGPISRFGTLELTIPRRSRPVVEQLQGVSGQPEPAAQAMAGLRALEKEALADPGGRFELSAPPAAAAIAQLFLPRLTDRLGARLALVQGADIKVARA